MMNRLHTLMAIMFFATALFAEPVTLGPEELAGWDLDPYIGQEVCFEIELTVCDTYNWERRGQLTLSADGRLFSKGNWKQNQQYPDRESGRLLQLDDGSEQEYPQPLAHTLGKYPLRVGDRLMGLKGTLVKNKYGIFLMHEGELEGVTHTSRPAAPVPRPELRLVSFNVLNYFLTLDERGADSEMELLRQQAKLLAAIAELDADLLGLIELENDEGQAMDRLLSALNSFEQGIGLAGDWQAVAQPSAGTGSDAIQVGLAFRQGRLKQVSPAINDRNPIHSRPPLGATFCDSANDEVFSAVVAHFKSKGCRGAEGENRDQGQGCWNAKRMEQAASLVQFATQLKKRADDPDVILLGDFNACAGEDPARVIEEAGYVALLDRMEDEERYSYIYKGESCALDHAYVTAEMDTQTMMAGIWHVNADEPRAWDYNMENRSRERYRPDPWRSSDHDPVWIDLRLGVSGPE